MTELIWDGKYVDGKRQSPVRVALPFQTIETVNESAADRQRSLELFSSGRETEWRNRLIWGDKKYVLPSLLPEFAGKVNLIYIDPPFNTGQDFSFTATIPAEMSSHDGINEFVKKPSLIEQKAYRDTWGQGLDSYLKWFHETILLLRELLAENGSIFVHLDVHMGPYAKVLLDEVFGPDNFMNQIAWYYYNKLHGQTKRCLPKAFDVIFWYSKSRASEYTYHTLTEARDKPVTKLKYRFVKGKIENLKDESGKTITYESTERQIDNVWRIRCLQPANLEEWVDFDTQKPIDFIERILQVASNAGDLVLDCFVGSGASILAAEHLGRRWIGADLGRFAIHTTRKRLLGVPNVRPFIVQNLGKYERQAWQTAEFPSNGKDHLEEQRQREAAYRKFILDLYHATPISGQTWLHGIKAGRMVHVGAVDAPVTISDVKAIAREVWKAASGAGAKAAVDILGWEFALELNETARNVAAESRVDVAFKKIPREVLEKKAVEQGDVKFFELGALSVDLQEKKREVTVKLMEFVIPLDDVPEEARKAIKHWSQMVDYWAVDWDFNEDTFHNQWQSYRTRKEPKIDLQAKYTYAEPGKYTIVVKVIDILGNDTTKTLEISVK
jgi:adenine-specific DNA-methyltransferase